MCHQTQILSDFKHNQLSLQFYIHEKAHGFNRGMNVFFYNFNKIKFTNLDVSNIIFIDKLILKIMRSPVYTVQLSLKTTEYEKHILNK